MKNTILLLSLFFNALLFSSEGFEKYDDGFYCGNTNQLDTLQIKMGSTVLNNFFIQETSSWVISSAKVAELNFTATNRSSSNSYINLQVIGFDKEDYVIFAMSGGPMFDMVGSNSAVSETIDTYVRPGVVRNIDLICIGAFGGS